MIAILGGIGSGKSSLARWVGARLPAEVIDADALGHEVLHRQDVRQQIHKHFGPGVFDAAGEIQRPVLAKIVFGEDPRPLRELEAITHPLIREAIRERIATAGQRGEVRAVLLDAAVLLESGWSDVCDSIVFVESSAETRQSRVLGRGWSAEQLHQREARQLPADEKRRRASFVVENEGELSVAGQQLLQYVTQFANQFSESRFPRSDSDEHLPPNTSESVAFRDGSKSNQ